MTEAENQKYYMSRALELAQHGRLHVAPNPKVGCVIVHKNRIIGEGYHTEYGKPHAEANAIEQVNDKTLLKESDLYVSLEPCSHYGKMPPCVDLIIKYHIPHVYVAVADPNPAVNGKGIEKLKTAGVRIDTGLLEKEAIALNKRFFCYHQQQRPYIILKWAQTLDGFMDSNQRGESNREYYWISNEFLRYKTHQWRAEEDAVLVGANTLLHDNPHLNVRYCAGKNPLRITWTNREIGSQLHFFDNSQPTLLFNYDKEATVGQTRFCKLSKKEDPLKAMIQHLYELKIQSLLIEGGQRTLQGFLDLNLWDEARVLVGNKVFGCGLSAPKLRQKPMLVENNDSNRLLWYKNKE